MYRFNCFIENAQQRFAFPAAALCDNEYSNKLRYTIHAESACVHIIIKVYATNSLQRIFGKLYNHYRIPGSRETKAIRMKMVMHNCETTKARIVHTNWKFSLGVKLYNGYTST